jgi:hypothetical protein
VLAEHEVAGRRHRDELGDALYEAEEKRLPPSHRQRGGCGEKPTSQHRWLATGHFWADFDRCLEKIPDSVHVIPKAFADLPEFGNAI